MEINKLKTFVDLAQTLNFSETAENLYINQSSVSKHIQSLEKELGCRLFIRNNKKVMLSEYGQNILDNAKEILNQDQELKNKIIQTKEEKRQKITIGTIPSFSNYRAFGTITNFSKFNPELNVQFKEIESNQLLNKLKANEIDIAFMRSFKSKITNFETIKVRRESFKVYLSTDDPLAQKHEIKLQQLKDRNFIMLAHDSLLYDPVIKLCKQAGFTPNVIFESDRLSSIYQMINQKQGIAILMNGPKKSRGIASISISPTQDSYLLFARTMKKHRIVEEKLWHYLQKNL